MPIWHADAELLGPVCALPKGEKPDGLDEETPAHIEGQAGFFPGPELDNPRGTLDT
jgi:hypothetical protein